MSKAVVYYFSGSGNSLAVARDIAGKIDGEPLAIPSVMGQDRITTDADVIGIVFPVYFATNENGGVPLIVGRFIAKLEGIGPKYVFAVCTHSGGPGTTIENFGKMIKARGGKLAAGFTVKMSAQTHPVEKIKHAVFHKGLRSKDVPDAQERYRQVYDDAAKKLDAIGEYVKAGREGAFETSGTLKKLLKVPFLLLMKPVFLRRYQGLSRSSSKSFNELIPRADHSFLYDEKCNGCGICARVCPVNNIEMADKKPVWQHRCENCLACYVWCPKGAIGGDIVAYNEWYHHPGVNL